MWPTQILVVAPRQLLVTHLRPATPVVASGPRLARVQERDPSRREWLGAETRGEEGGPSVRGTQVGALRHLTDVLLQEQPYHVAGGFRLVGVRPESLLRELETP